MTHVNLIIKLFWKKLLLLDNADTSKRNKSETMNEGQKRIQNGPAKEVAVALSRSFLFISDLEIFQLATINERTNI